MFDNKNPGQILNQKILRSQIELSQFKYEILFIVPANLMQLFINYRVRVVQAYVIHHLLHEIHVSGCLPGITRVYHFVKLKNLPFSLDDVRRVCNACKICLEIKPHIY